MSAIINQIFIRNISTTAVRNGKRNFKKFPLFNKRGSRQFKEAQRTNPDPELFHNRGVRAVGYKLDDKFVTVPEKIPELIVPDLKDFELKPYVSYRTPDVIQSEFTAEDLFNVVYSEKIAKDFKERKLDANGNSLNPSPEEQLSPEEARIKAKQTGSDIF